MNAKHKPRLHQDWIDPHAFGILNALKKQGFTTYLVGGCVRDLLLGIKPKDFDIATDAKPNEVRRIIHNSYVIGKRFRLVLAKRGDQLFEISTFRRTPREDEEREDLPAGDNVFGSPEEDANRRDFTINALFYDPVENELIDYSRGVEDLNAGLVKMIGEPTKRLVEDPIRILRAIRLAHKIRFSLDSDLRQAMQAQANSLRDSALPRRREEFLKFLRLQDPALPFMESYDLGVLGSVAPTFHKAMEDSQSEEFLHHLRHLNEHGIPDTPLDLFAGVVRAYVRSYLSPDPESPIKAKDLLEHPDLISLMRDELGMFKYEQAIVTKAFQLQNLMNQTEKFLKKGERRQQALLFNPSFPLALKFSEADLFLPSENLHFWQVQYESALPEIMSRDVVKAKKGRRTRRKGFKSKVMKPSPEKLDETSESKVE